MFKLILVCMAALLVAQQTDAIVVLNRFTPVVAPLGIARVIVPVVRPVVVARPFIGKREVPANITECVLSSESSKIVCAGVNQLSCDLSYNFTGLGNFSFIVKDLALHKVDKEVIDKVNMSTEETTVSEHIEKVETVVEIKKHIEPIFQFLAESEIVEHKIVSQEHTFVNPTDNKPVILSLYSSEDMTELGFRIKDHQCWEQFEKIVEMSKPEEIEFELVISQLEKSLLEKSKFDIKSEDEKMTTEEIIKTSEEVVKSERAPAQRETSDIKKTERAPAAREVDNIKEESADIKPTEERSTPKRESEIKHERDMMTTTVTTTTLSEEITKSEHEAEIKDIKEDAKLEKTLPEGHKMKRQRGNL